MKNKIKPSFRLNRRPFVKIYFIFLIVNSQTNKKILSQGLLFGSIPAFNFMVQNVYSKNKNQNKSNTAIM